MVRMQEQATNALARHTPRLFLVFLLLVGLLGSCERADYILGVLDGDGGSCVDDEAPCSLNEECCSGLCEDEACSPLNNACKTSGNSCQRSDDCCSGLCAGGTCSPASSYCSQEGDSCQVGGDCCSGTCLIVGDHLQGTCDAVPQGPSNCSKGIAGSLCDDCNDCCSRVCAEYGDGATKICLMAEGCRQTGELCNSDAQCCGGDPDSGLPGAGNVSCEIQEGATWGICRNAMSCSPQGNVCHIQDYVCTVSAAPNRCCSEEGNEGVCILDEGAVPRCDGLAGNCREEGASCSMNNDCCSGSCLWSDDVGYVCASESTL